MAKYEELLEVILEANVVDKPYLFKMTNDRLRHIKNDIDTAKKNKDIDELEKISEKIEKIIDEIEKFDDYKSFKNIDEAYNVTIRISAIILALATCIPAGILTKGTLDGLRGIKNETIINQRDIRENGLKEYEKYDYEKIKRVSKVSTAGSLIALKYAVPSKMDYMNTAMYSLKKDIDKLKKLNKQVKREISKNKKRFDEEYTKEFVKIEIYESFHSGEIDEAQRDELLSMLE